MISVYGKVDDNDYEKYLKRIVGKIFKIIPMQEEKDETLEVYVQAVSREVFGLNKNILSGEEIIEVINILNGIDLTNHETMRSDVFTCIGLIKKPERSDG